MRRIISNIKIRFRTNAQSGVSTTCEDDGIRQMKIRKIKLRKKDNSRWGVNRR